jgi:hypothetical protein
MSIIGRIVREDIARGNRRDSMYSSTEVKEADVQVGDWAQHRGGLDGRKVVAVDHERGMIQIDLVGTTSVPLPMEAYTFRRITP